MKKILFLVSLFLLSISIVGAQPAYDNKNLTEETAQFVFSLNSDKKEVQPGDEIAITYRLDKMTEYGLRTISYELVYDHRKIAPEMVMNEDGDIKVAHEFGQVGKDDRMSTLGIVLPTNDPTKNMIRCVGLTDYPTHNTGDVVTFYFKVLNSAPEGKIDIYVGQGVATAGALEDESTDYHTTFYIKSNVEDLKVVNNPNPPAKKEIGETNISNIKDQLYTGALIEPNLIIADGLRGLVPGQDYMLSYENNVKVGTATVTITGIGDYTGTTTRTFNIVEELSKNIADANIIVANKNYTGKALSTTVVVKLNDTTLVNGKDYKVTYKNNKNPGTATVTITGIGDYEGTVTKTFKIQVPAPTSLTTSAQATNNISVKWNKVGIANGYEVYYATSATSKYSKLTTISKNGTVTYKKTGLTAGKTYYFKVRSYVTINGKKYYSNYSTILVTTTKPATPKMKISSYSASSITPSWAKISGASGYEIYRATSKNGTYTKIDVKNVLKYQNTGLKSATTYYYKMRAYKTLNGKKVYSAYSNVISSTTKPAAPTVTVTSTKDTATIKWAKLSGVSGYEVYQATSANGTYKKLTTTTSTSYKKTGLAIAKTYYYKVRAYKTVSGKKIYGGYSTVIASTTAPATPSIIVKTTSDSATVKWTQTSGATGYEVWYSNSKTGTYVIANTIEKASTTSTTITEFAQPGTYYFKVRAYKLVGTTKVYGAFSNIVSAKITIVDPDR